jgi:hypothetical protein
MPDEAERQDSYQAYPETVLTFEGGPRLDLRRPLGSEERRDLARLELGPSFAVLTAENPGGDSPEHLGADQAAERDRENIRRTLRLEERLAREGVPFRRVEGTAPDGSHRERCVAVAMSREAAERLAGTKDQVALFWYDGERFWLWPAQVAEEPRALPAP